MEQGHTHFSTSCIECVDDFLINRAAADCYDSISLIDADMVEFLEIDENAILNGLKLWCIAMTTSLGKKLDISRLSKFDLL